jgi:hypothetical protein
MQTLNVINKNIIVEGKKSITREVSPNIPQNFNFTNRNIVLSTALKDKLKLSLQNKKKAVLSPQNQTKQGFYTAEKTNSAYKGNNVHHINTAYNFKKEKKLSMPQIDSKELGYFNKLQNKTGTQYNTIKAQSVVFEQMQGSQINNVPKNMKGIQIKNFKEIIKNVTLPTNSNSDRIITNQNQFK